MAYPLVWPRLRAGIGVLVTIRSTKYSVRPAKSYRVSTSQDVAFIGGMMGAIRQSLHVDIEYLLLGWNCFSIGLSDSGILKLSSCGSPTLKKSIRSTYTYIRQPAEPKPSTLASPLGAVPSLHNSCAQYSVWLLEWKPLSTPIIYINDHYHLHTTSQQPMHTHRVESCKWGSVNRPRLPLRSPS